MNWFTTCRTLEEAKKLYHKLMMENHPDRGGDTETAKAINGEFELFCTRFVGDAFTRYTNDTGRPVYRDGGVFGKVLAAAVKLNCRIEVIGYWIYAFESYEVREALKELGFWFSKKHKAWIFSGGKKKPIRTKLTTDDNRRAWGSELIREKDEQIGIPA